MNALFACELLRDNPVERDGYGLFFFVITFFTISFHIITSYGRSKCTEYGFLLLSCFPQPFSSLHVLSNHISFELDAGTHGLYCSPYCQSTLAMALYLPRQ
jgi:hypothetical protein